MSADLPAALEKFVSFAQSLKGDEKGEAPIYLNALFQAFGHDGTQQAGATHEHRIAKGAGAKGKNFADLLWPQRVLFEMKSRGVKLERHYDQAFDYWTHIVPHRPPYVVLCNFDEFWIYDFNQQLFDPVDKIKLADLPQRWSALAFLLPHEQKPLFANNRVEVTRKAAAKLAELFRALLQRGEDRARAQRFVLQLLVALVSEDMGLLPDFILSRLIQECREQKLSTFDLIGGLFRQMNSDKPAPGGRFQGVPYFNGGLFADIDALDLSRDEITILEQAADFDWSMVKPEIFGTLFQASMDDGSASGRDERHAFGAHFTSEFDIQKVVGPTIVRPWRERMAKVWNKVGQLKEVLRDLRLYRVLDPACGSGNFLYVAYRELKRLEREILLRLSEISKGEPLETAVSIHQFYGLDIMPFAVELAKVTLMLAKEQEVREAAKLQDSDGLLVLEQPLPLDNLDKNIVCADALFTEWPKADAIIGNPPYLGAKLLKPEYGPDYVKKLRKAYPEMPGMADFCVYWFRKAHAALEECTEENSCGGRAGLVGTQNVRNNYSRIGGLDYIVRDGTIIEAIDNQDWSGEAKVHVSIVNWVKTQNPTLLPAKRIIWSRVDPAKGSRRKDATSTEGSSLDLREVDHINSALSDAVDVSVLGPLAANTKPQRCFNGQMIGHEGFLMSADEREKMVTLEPNTLCVTYPYLNGMDALTGARLDRFVIDFEQRDRFEAEEYRLALQRIRERVLPDRQRKAEEGKDADGKVRSHHKAFLARWWQLSFGRPEMLAAIKPLNRFMACAYVTKRPIFMFVSTSVRPSNLIQVFTFEDDYSFGILQSTLHWVWFTTKCGKLKSDFRYSAESVFDTFPWPQHPTLAQIEAVAVAAVAVRTLRHEIMQKLDYSLRELYRTLEDPGENPLRSAHARLDDAVRAAYGMPKDADILQFLLDLNLALAAKEKAGEPITPPGLPLPQSEHARFVTEDCIKADLIDGGTDESRAAAAHFHSSIVQEEPAKYG